MSIVLNTCGDTGLSLCVLKVQPKPVLSKPAKWEIIRQCNAKTTSEEGRSRPPKLVGTKLAVPQTLQQPEAATPK